MCLEKAGEKLVATEDIVCYKRILIGHLPINELLPFHGKKAKAVVYNYEYDVVISVHDGQLFLCSNDSDINGLECPERFGHRYSWQFDNTVSDLTCEDTSLINNKNFITPYQRAEVALGNTYKSKLIKERYDKVHEGLHSFKHASSARENGDGRVVRCVIPKGSEYYEGLFGGEGYASNTIKYVEIIP